MDSRERMMKSLIAIQIWSSMAIDILSDSEWDGDAEHRLIESAQHGLAKAYRRLLRGDE